MCGRWLFNLETHRFALTLILMQEIPAWLKNLLRWVSTFLIESLGELANVVHAYNPSTQEVESRKLGIQGHPKLHLKIKVNLRLWRGGGERRKRMHRGGCSGGETARLRNCQSSESKQRASSRHQNPTFFPYESNDVTNAKERSISLW